MKLKYYLRGLGVGIFISTIILSISFSAKNRTLTNVEIMNKAEELGMVKEEDIERAVSEKLEKIKQEEELAEETSKEEVVAAEETSKEEEVVAEEIPKEEEMEEELPEEESNVVESVVISISSGMWSDDVSKLLENNGIIESAGSFNTYLIENGYQHKIRTGEYTLLKGTSFEEIAKKITSR